MAELVLMMGIPGSGKSTLVSNFLNPDHEIYVSRDEIRFSLVKENEEYFSKETEVFNTFIEKIKAGLREDKNVFADATHLTKKSRQRVLRALGQLPDAINIIWVKTPLDEALRRNEFRKETRAFVPRETIRRMYFQLEPPTFEELPQLREENSIWVKEPEKIIYQLERN